MAKIQQRLQELGIQLPQVAEPLGSYKLYTRVGDLIFVSGQGPRVGADYGYIGKLGAGISMEDGYTAASLSVQGCLAILEQAVGLDNVKQIVSLRGFVNSTDDFTQQPTVINGASDLLIQIFGEDGRPARCAVSVNGLPLGIAVEVELVAQIQEGC